MRVKDRAQTAAGTK